MTAKAVRVLDALPPEEMAFRFLSGRPCLDLCATVGERWGRNFERLRTPADLDRWLRQAGLHSDGASASAPDLRAVRGLRDAVYAAATAAASGRSVPASAQATITAAAQKPPLAPAMRAGRVRWSPGQPVAAAISTLARDAIDLLTGPLRGRVRECESDQCSLLYVDASRPGHRRWCSSETCGGRARAAAYRSRRGL